MDLEDFPRSYHTGEDPSVFSEVVSISTYSTSYTDLHYCLATREKCAQLHASATASFIFILSPAFEFIRHLSASKVHSEVMYKLNTFLLTVPQSHVGASSSPTLYA